VYRTTGFEGAGRIQPQSAIAKKRAASAAAPVNIRVARPLAADSRAAEAVAGVIRTIGIKVTVERDQ